MPHNVTRTLWKNQILSKNNVIFGKPWLQDAQPELHQFTWNPRGKLMFRWTKFKYTGSRDLPRISSVSGFVKINSMKWARFARENWIRILIMVDILTSIGLNNIKYVQSFSREIRIESIVIFGKLWLQAIFTVLFELLPKSRILADDFDYFNGFLEFIKSTSESLEFNGEI